MKRTRTWTVSAIAVVAAVWFLVPSEDVRSQAVREVFVVNWPEVQTIEGEVSVVGPVRLSSMNRIDDVVVPPVNPRDTTRLVDAGTIETDGFAHVVLSLTGETKGDVTRPGIVGAFLIPDEDGVLNAFNEEGETLFALEVQALGVSGASAYFASNQPRYQVGFPRYRVLLYNSSDKTVEIDLFAYRTN